MTYHVNTNMNLLLIVGKYDYHKLVELLEDCDVCNLDDFTIVFMDKTDKSNVSVVCTSNGLIDCIRPHGNIGLLALVTKLRDLQGKIGLYDRIQSYLIETLMVY